VKGLKKSLKGSGTDVGGRRVTMVRLAKRSKPKIRNAHTRLEESVAVSPSMKVGRRQVFATYIAQGKPISEIKRSNIIGKKMPLRLEPQLTRPIAKPLLLRNHVETQATAGHKSERTVRIEQETPTRREETADPDGTANAL